MQNNEKLSTHYDVVDRMDFRDKPMFKNRNTDSYGKFNQNKWTINLYRYPDMKILIETIERNEKLLMPCLEEYGIDKLSR